MVERLNPLFAAVYVPLARGRTEINFWNVISWLVFFNYCLVEVEIFLFLDVSSGSCRIVYH